MFTFRFSHSVLSIAILGLIALSFTMANAADIAVVDFADQWTKVDALRQTLNEFGIAYDDLTTAVENANLPLTTQKLLFIGSMVTNNPTLHQNLDANAKAIQDFVAGGGVVIETTQADQNESNVDWLPDGLVCVRTDADSPQFTINKPDHPLFNTPNPMRNDMFQGWGHQGWPTVWEVIGSQKGFDTLAESQGRPAIMEAEFGSGKFVMMCLAPDKYHIAGNDDLTKQMAGLLMRNILQTYTQQAGGPTAVQSAGKLAAKWADLKSRYSR